MKTNNQFREKMLNHPTYWVEGINGLLYDGIISYMKKHKMKRKDLAKHLGISAGRVSQILNDGDINFSLEKIVDIAIKVDKFPIFAFEDKNSFLERERKLAEVKRICLHYDRNEVSIELPAEESSRTKIIPLVPKIEVSQNYTVSNQLVYIYGN
jgi:transcriptional regulator with XRE-family HTH domain